MYVSIEFFHFEQLEGNGGDSGCPFDTVQIVQLTRFIALAV